MLAVQQPLGLKGGDQGGELRLEEMVRVAGEVKKAFVAPDDVVRIRPEMAMGMGLESMVRREALSTPLARWSR